MFSELYNKHRQLLLNQLTDLIFFGRRSWAISMAALVACYGYLVILDNCPLSNVDAARAMAQLEAVLPSVPGTIPLKGEGKPSRFRNIAKEIPQKFR